MFKKLALLLVLSLTLISCSAVSAYAMTMHLVRGTDLGFDERSFTTHSEAGHWLSFIMDKNNVVHLADLSTNKDLLSFIPMDGTTATAYRINEIHTYNPQKILFEITAVAGAHGKNVGYWLIGQYKGKWVTYISWNNLAKMGFTTHNWHQLTGEIDQGQLYIKSVHEYMPPGAEFQYQRQLKTDLIVEAIWNDHAQWFGMRTVYP